MVSLNNLIHSHAVNNNINAFFQIFDYVQTKKHLLANIQNCKFAMDIKFKIYETYRTALFEINLVNFK